MVHQVTLAFLVSKYSFLNILFLVKVDLFQTLLSFTVSIPTFVLADALCKGLSFLSETNLCAPVTIDVSQ
jgi:hypothetical protein